MPIPGLVAFADEKTRAEVAAMLYIASHTTIRVPRIYHWGTADDNFTGLDLPFIIMEYIPYTHTMYGLILNPTRVERPELNGDDTLIRQHLYRQLANMHIQLAQLRHSSISALDVVDNRSVPGGTPIPLFLNQQIIANHVPEAILAPAFRSGKTISTTRQWHVFNANIYVAGLLYNQDPDRSADDIRSSFVARYLFRQLALNRKLPRRADDDGSPAEGSSEESFRLWCDDMGTHNILCNEQGDIQGVIDWEFVYFAPESFAYDLPLWLIVDTDLESLKDAQQDNESASEQQDMPNDEGVCKDEGVVENDSYDYRSKEQFKRGHEIFMRVLQLEERELYKQKRGQASERNTDSSDTRPHLHQREEDLVAQVSGLNIQDDETTIPTPFYDRMTQRWEKEESESMWNLTHMLDRDDFDEWYWTCLDQEHGGERGGNYHDRLDLLPPRVKDLMEWFVHRRTEERDKWDPAELLEAVLGQMDGTGPFVTAVEDQASSS